MSEIVGVFGINIKLIIVQAVNFGLLLLVLSYVLYRPLLRVLRERRAKIEQGVRDAETAERRKNALEEQKTAIVAVATREGEEIVERARIRAREAEAALLADAEKRDKAAMTAAEERAREIKRNAEEESRTEVARMALLAAEKILRERIKKREHETA